MPLTLDTPATERGTYAVTVAFRDDAGASVAPNSGLTWTLTDAIGTVVNSRSAVAISSAASVTVVLSGADLAIDDDYLGTVRLLTFRGTYNSSLGSNLPLNEQVEFTISNLVAIS
jgi:hypothetical protein